MRIVECVPNISEGRDRAIIDAVAHTVDQVEGCELLDIDPGAATNRTVITFVGPPDRVVDAAFLILQKAQELIDMSQHHGEHPRFGATDVCPFVPVSEVTMEECAELARQLGERVGRELDYPVYLYEHAASCKERRNLATIRQGEYEGLAKRLGEEKWRPDFGPAEFRPRTGVTAIGAREFLVAYNVNVNTRDKRIPHQIALAVREMGRSKRDENWKIVRDEKGRPVKEPGRLKNVKGIGWYIDEFKTAQVSMNLTNFLETPVHTVFDVCCEEAEKLGMRVTGSEIVGLVPLKALTDAGRHYQSKMNKSAGVAEEELVDIAIKTLGLNDVVPFDPQEKVIEYRLRQSEGLRTMKITDFADVLSSEEPAPGGGSVAALCGALAGGLAAMVPNLSITWRSERSYRDEMSRVAEQAQALKDWFLLAIDADTEAFNKIIDANRMPQSTTEEKAAQAVALREANRGATMVPLSVLEKCVEIFDLAEVSVAKGNKNALSDAGVAGLCAMAGAEAAYYNVLINLNSMVGDEEWVGETRANSARAMAEAEAKAAALKDKVRHSLGV